MTSLMTDAPNTLVNMVSGNLDGIPSFDLAPGYRFRTYREGDAEVWTDLHLAAELFVEVTPDLFFQQFGAAVDALPDRMFFVETEDGQPVGSISAWWEKDRFRPAERGRIHWVVVHPDHQGRGIAKAMMTRAMHRLSRSHDSAMLETSSGRPGAIKVYLDCGFRPDPCEQDDLEVAAAWIRVLSGLKHPALEEYLLTIRDG